MTDHIEFDSITDEVYNVGQGLSLKMSVKLSRKTNEGNRNYFHKEYRYKSTYTDMEYARTIKRSFDYFLIFEKYKTAENDEKVYIQIRPQNIMFLQQTLNFAMNWLLDDDLYTVRDNKYTITKNISMKKVIDLPMGKWMGFEPVVIYYDNNNTYDRGIRIYLSSDSTFVDISGNQFMGLVYTISTMSMYECALNLVNYINRPEEGTNMMTFENQFNPNQDFDDGVECKTNRKINTNGSKSFFDRLDNL